jgi:hypothetical protein
MGSVPQNKLMSLLENNNNNGQDDKTLIHFDVDQNNYKLNLKHYIGPAVKKFTTKLEV